MPLGTPAHPISSEWYVPQFCVLDIGLGAIFVHVIETLLLRHALVRALAKMELLALRNQRPLLQVSDRDLEAETVNLFMLLENARRASTFKLKVTFLGCHIANGPPIGTSQFADQISEK